MANKLNLDFSGGMNSHTAPLVSKDNEAEFILNYNLDKSGALTKRNGYEKFVSNGLFYTSGLFGALNPDNGVGYYYRTTNDAEFATATKRITYYYKSADAAWTATDDNAQQPFLPTTGAANQLHKTRFASFLNYVFRVNGADSPKSFLVTTPQTVTTVNLKYEDANAIGILSSLIAVYADRVYLNDASNSKRSRVYFSTVGVPGGTITWGASAAAQQYFDVNPDDGDLITAFENNGNHLLIFKSNAMYRWIWGQVEADRIIGVGTPSQESVATHFETGTTFFANPRGVYAYNGNKPKLISRKIQEYIDAISTAQGSWRYVSGGVDSEHYYLSVGDIIVNGRTISNAVLVYHILFDAWTIYSLATQPTVFADVPSISVAYPKRELIFGSLVGTDYKFTTATSDLLISDTKSIESEVVTKEHLLVFPEKTTLENIDVLAIQGSDTRVSYQLDRNLMGREGDFVSCKGGLNNRVNTFRVGKEMHTVRLRLSDNSLRSSTIEGYNLEHTPKKTR